MRVGGMLSNTFSIASVLLCSVALIDLLFVQRDASRLPKTFKKIQSLHIISATEKHHFISSLVPHPYGVINFKK